VPRVPIPLVALGVVLGGACQGGERRRAAAEDAAGARAGSPGAAGGEPAVAGPGRRRDVTALVDGALRGAIGDLDGDGVAELVLVGGDRLRVVDAAGTVRAEAAAPGGIQVLTVADLDGDGRAEILAGWGISREHRAALAQIDHYRLEGPVLTQGTIDRPVTTRQEIAALVPAGGGDLWIAAFADKYEVRLSRARRGPDGWRLEEVERLRMATAYATGDVDGDGVADLLVGRVYGDAQGLDGDAFLRRPDGTRVTIPTTRGVRAIAVADVDGDGRAEVFLGDGWHRDYARQARGLLTGARWQDGAFAAETLEDTPGQFTLWQILAVDVDGDGRPELVTRGNRYVRVYRHAEGRWHGLTIAGEARDVAVGDLDDRPGAEILILGERSEIVSLDGVRWP
jgi:hypothetical protein